MTERAMLEKMSRRCRIGWIDFTSGSWDWRVASARLWRINQRLKGRRITLAQAMQE